MVEPNSKGAVMKNALRIFPLLIAVTGCGQEGIQTESLAAIARVDEVTEWNQIKLDALIAGNVGGIVATRHAAIVQSAVYDAVNGIERRYTPIHMLTLRRRVGLRDARQPFRRPMPLW
jgi:hypothetical protein